MELIRALKDPFPHLIVENMYNEKELELIWEELYFLTKPNKLLTPDKFGAAYDGVGNYVTKSHAVELDTIYLNRNISNILSLNRKLFNEDHVWFYEAGNHADLLKNYFEALEDSCTVVVKYPSVSNDKYLGIKND